MKTIDLRSDTVTRPTSGMREAMMNAELGDDVYGEDPSVNQLQNLVSEMTGKEAGLFVPSGTQGNLLAILSHCERGEEYIAGQQAHCYKYEAGGAAVLGGVHPQPLEYDEDGSLGLAAVAATIKPDDDHFAMTSLLCLENTQGGKVLSRDYQAQAKAFAKNHNLKLHLDGARAFNAAVSDRVAVGEITQHYDSVSLCLSKGLGAPVGSVLVGTRAFIKKARRWRKMVGGGMRQAGVLAAAGIYALENNLERLTDDHANAAILAEGLKSIKELNADIAPVETNMVFLYMEQDRRERLSFFLNEQGIRVGGYGQLRMVTHRDVDADDISLVVEAVKKFVATDHKSVTRGPGAGG